MINRPLTLPVVGVLTEPSEPGSYGLCGGQRVVFYYLRR